MTLHLPTFAVAFAAFCVWLTVRIVNRRERWAKWTLAAMVGLPVLYVASFGPACWIYGRTESHKLPGMYLPLEGAFYRDSPVRGPMLWFAGIGMGPETSVALPQNDANWLRTISGGDLEVYYVGRGGTF